MNGPVPPGPNAGSGATSPDDHDRHFGPKARLLLGTVALALFLFAVRLMAGATQEMTPDLAGGLPAFLDGPLSALAAGWLLTYVLFNGSVAAAVALTFAGAGILDPLEFVLMLAGTRLGSASFLLLLGGLDFLRRGTDSLRRSSELGLLTFLVTHSVYLPATALAVWLVPGLATSVGVAVPVPALDVPALDLLPTLADRAVAWIGPAFALAAGLVLLLAAFRLLDRIVGELDPDRVRERYLSRLGRPWPAFGLGAVVTALTASVAFSVGAVLPPYNRGMVRREEAIPYLLGANVGTLSDTFVVAVLLGTPAGLGAVVLLGGSAAAASILALLAIRWYGPAVDRGLEAVTGTRAAAAGFVASLVVVPAILLWL
jgi:sodium-dependent phosphate cotransporter